MDNHALELRVAQLEKKLAFWEAKFKQAGEKRVDPVRQTGITSRIPDKPPERLRQAGEDRIRRLCQEPSQSPGSHPRNRSHGPYGRARPVF